MSKTMKEEFMSAFKEEMEIARKLDKLQKAIEGAVDDLELIGRLLNEFDSLQRRAQEVDLDYVDVKISKLMSELGLVSEDADRHVASFSSGWQMRMSLGKILLQLCTKIVETGMGVSRNFEGNYSQYVISKAEWVEAQNAAWEKQHKEIEATNDLISRLSVGANSGRASSAEKKLERLQEEEPFQRKQMKIRFPECGLS